VDVEIRDVAPVFAELDAERIDLLKMNIEGAEFDVLERLAETGWIDRIDELLIQFHDWAPAAPRRRRMIRRVLARTHTEVWNYPWVWERWVRRRS
jgi:Methyltransferase FkbM domain